MSSVGATSTHGDAESRTQHHSRRETVDAGLSGQRAISTRARQSAEILDDGAGDAGRARLAGKTSRSWST